MNVVVEIIRLNFLGDNHIRYYLYDEFEEIREIIKSIPRYSSQEDIFWLRIHSKDSYNKEEWNNETKKNQLFKSSYKEDETVRDSYFDYLVKRKL